MRVSTLLRGTVPAFACGAAVAIAALVSWQDVRAQSKRYLHACTVADGTLHVTPPAVPCQPGERRVRIPLPEEKEPEECKEDERAAKLERRIADLESEGGARHRRVRAPFEVEIAVFGQKRTLLRIDESGVTFSNRDGKPVVVVLADDTGGMIQTQSSSGARESEIRALDKRAHLLLKESGHERIDMGRSSNGRYGLEVFGRQNKVIAYFGQSAEGQGFAQVNGVDGTRKASMFVHDGSGHLEVWNAAGKMVGLLTTGVSGAGQFHLMDGSGKTMVEAGVNGNGQGVVRTGPKLRQFGAGLVGLPPSMILGNAN